MTNFTLTEKKKFYQLQFIRAVTIFLTLLALATVIDLGARPALLALTGILGASRGGVISRRGVVKALLECAITSLICLVLRSVIFFVAKELGIISQGSLWGVTVRDTMLVLLLAYSISLVSTVIFWRYRSALTVEILAVALFFAAILSGHRNYHLDAPKEFSQLAWRLEIDPQHFLLGIGIGLSVLLGLYLAIATSRPIVGAPRIIRTAGRIRKASVFILPVMLLLLFVGYARFINSRYGDNLSRASEGVGENTEEGKSPLGFHSAVGKTKQPAALVRLEGDYSNNPWAPMLYLREGALSSFSGKELVLAPREFDVDTPRGPPGQPYLSLEQEPGLYRQKLAHSVFLLAKHKTAIGIDFPQSIRPIKNPDSNRFNAAYQVYSFAPSVRLDSLIGENVGDPKWDRVTLEHYLRAPGSLESSPALPDVLKEFAPDTHNEDLRYRALAHMLSDDTQPPVERARSIIDYLSANSIYTRQPGHQVTDGGDPVAPYLFADEKRGYCVHFAHAAVYLLRLSGIPARIGTGYLTDLTYAKDGHILLNMGDRHAWPEIYIAGFGWAIVDIQPAKAENEQIVAPDEKLLNELMNKLDQAGDFTPPPSDESAEQKIRFDDQLVSAITDSRLWSSLLVLLIFSFMLLKLYLRFGYLCARDARRRSLRAYVAFASTFSDLGNSREFGETNLEFSKRVHSEAQGLSTLADRASFDPQFNVSSDQIDLTLERALSQLTSWRGFLKKCLAFISPLSLLRWRKW